MPTPVLRLSAVLLGLLALRGTPLTARGAEPAKVVAESLEVFLEPDETSFATDQLHRGDGVRVIATDPATGWATIEPPESAFAWVESKAIQRGPGGVGRVVAKRARVRAGVVGAKMPGPPRGSLAQNASVRLLDRPPAAFGAGSPAHSWVAIAPPTGDVRHVHANGVALQPAVLTAPASATPEDRTAAPAPTPVPVPVPAASAPIRGAKLPPQVAAEAGLADAEHRAALRHPMVEWQLDKVRARYERLVKGVNDPEALNHLNARLAQVQRHQEMARSAQTVAGLLAKTRSLDEEVDLTRRALAELDRPGKRPYVARGLMQPSSREVEGRQVYVLVGSDGREVAFLDIPPGLDARPLLTRRVGVRGHVRYNETLGARVIAVRDLDALE